MNMPDHPIIRNMERTGYPDGKIPKVYYCPCCNNETDELYIDDWDNVVGCPNCVHLRDAWELEGDD